MHLCPLMKSTRQSSLAKVREKCYLGGLGSFTGLLTYLSEEGVVGLVNQENRSGAGGPVFKAHLPKTARKENGLSQGGHPACLWAPWDST